MSKKDRKIGGMTEEKFMDTIRRTDADKWLHRGPGRKLLFILATMAVPLIIAHIYSFVTTGQPFDLLITFNLPWYIPGAVLFCATVFWETQREKAYDARDEKLDEIELQIETRATAWAGERVFQTYFATFIVLLWFPGWYQSFAWLLPLLFAAEFVWVRWAKRSMLRQELNA